MATDTQTETQEVQQEIEQSEGGSFLERHWQKIVAVVLWLAFIGAYVWYTTSSGIGVFNFLEVGRRLLEVMSGNLLIGALIYIGVYALRPLIFFSAGVLTLIGGAVFGPIWGIIFTIVGGNLSAMVAFVIGYFFGEGIIDPDESEGIIQRYADRMRKNSFETVLIMRVIYLPYDLVNYLAGLLRIDWKAFLFATILGNLPGTVSIVLVGASSGLSEGNLSFDWRVAAIGVVLGVAGFFLARVVRSRTEDDDEDEGEMQESTQGA